MQNPNRTDQVIRDIGHSNAFRIWLIVIACVFGLPLLSVMCMIGLLLVSIVIPGLAAAALAIIGIIMAIIDTILGTHLKP